MTLIIDDQSDPGSYAPYFERAETYNAMPDLLALAASLAADLERQCVEMRARCYRDRKAHDKLIATTNAIRAKHGMDPLGGRNG